LYDPEVVIPVIVLVVEFGVVITGEEGPLSIDQVPVPIVIGNARSDACEEQMIWSTPAFATDGKVSKIT
jgi:hypothetical protein